MLVKVANEHELHAFKKEISEFMETVKLQAPQALSVDHPMCRNSFLLCGSMQSPAHHTGTPLTPQIASDSSIGSYSATRY